MYVCIFGMCALILYIACVCVCMYVFNIGKVEKEEGKKQDSSASSTSDDGMTTRILYCVQVCMYLPMHPHVYS